MTKSLSNGESSELDFILAHRAESARGLPVTYALIGIFIFIYALSLYLSSRFHELGFTPVLAALKIMGAMNSEDVGVNREWYRLLTATLLHGNILHLALNSYALYVVGRFLEPLLGKAWFIFLFALGGLAGSLLGWKINSPEIVSVGASGAIMGLFTILGIASFRVPRGRLRSALQIDAVQVLIPSLIPLGISIGGSKIDYAAHLGGALGGVVGGGLLLLVWQRGKFRPESGLGARFLCLISVLAYIGAAAWAFESGQKEMTTVSGALAAYQKIMPDSDFRVLELQNTDKIEQALKSYPQDPRLLWIRGNHFLRKEKFKEAEDKFRLALDQSDTIASVFSGGDLKQRIELSLALSLFAQKRELEAKQLMEPLCDSPFKSKMTQDERDFFCGLSKAPNRE